MTDRTWRVHLVLLGWAAILLGAAAVGWLYAYGVPGRYVSAGKDGVLRLDRRSGELRIVNPNEVEGRVLMGAAPLPGVPGTPPRYGLVIDDLGVIPTPTPE